MKNLYSILLAVFIYVPVSAQRVTLRFEGVNNNSSDKNYIAEVDGRKYYSSDAAQGNNSATKQIQIDDLVIGSHKLNVYDAGNSSTVSSTTTDPLYSNTFQLRSGYDMVIAVRKNGQVSFSEKRINQNAVASTHTPMTQTEFDKLLQSIKAKWSQTSKYTAIKTALSNTSYFFTTDQVGQLLLPLTTESKRLELAKLSYPRVTDPNNFGDVVDLFSTQANKDNINKFIQSKNPEVVANTNTAIDASRPPLTTQQFNQLQRKIKNQYQESGKYAVLSDALNVTTNYFTTEQLRQLLSLISPESDRLVLAKQSYTRVADQTNFYNLASIFTSQASKDDFNNFIRNGETTTSSTSTQTGRVAMSDGDFSKLQWKARLHIHQASIVKDINTAFSDANNYFTVDQIRSLLTMVSSESDRLTLAKLAYHRIVDPTSFTGLFDLFSSQTSLNDLNNYIKTNKS